MSISPIAATAGTARQRLASSLAALQQDANLPADILEIVSGLARAMGPLFQVERGTGDPSLLFTARAVLQETLGRMQLVDQAHPGVGDATAAIAQSLGMIFATIKEHGIRDPAAPAAPPAHRPAPAIPPPVVETPSVVVAGSLSPEPPTQPINLVNPAARPIDLVHPVARPMPLVQPPQNAPPIAHPAAVGGGAFHAPQRPSYQEAQRPSHMEPVASVYPDTAAKVPIGPNGLPRVEAELDVHSETNFFTNFLGDIRDHGGIFVATYSALAMNTTCEVVIAFPGALTAEVRGVVAWKREANNETGLAPGLGIEITWGGPDAWKLIDRFIKNREPINYES